MNGVCPSGAPAEATARGRPQHSSQTLLGQGDGRRPVLLTFPATVRRRGRPHVREVRGRLRTNHRKALAEGRRHLVRAGDLRARAHPRLRHARFESSTPRSAGEFVGLPIDVRVGCAVLRRGDQRLAVGTACTGSTSGRTAARGGGRSAALVMCLRVVARPDSARDREGHTRRGERRGGAVEHFRCRTCGFESRGGNEVRDDRAHPQSASRSPDARSTRRFTDSRSTSGVPYNRTVFFARVTPV